MQFTKILSLMIFCLIFSSSKTEAINDIFIVYSKENNTMKNIIIEALDTQTKKWERIAAPIPEEFWSTSTYTPINSNHQDPSEGFFFEDLHLAKHPKLHSLNDLYFNQINNKPKEFSSKLIFQNDQTIAFETYNPSNKGYQRHQIHYYVDAGNGNFRGYTYRKRYTNLEEHEKEFWIHLFQYMEQERKAYPILNDKNMEQAAN
jgi:hypothetical protein